MSGSQERRKTLFKRPPGRRMQVFIVCLLISTFIWFTREFSKDFSTTLEIPVEFVDLPEELVVAGDYPEVINVNVNSHGFSVFGQSVLGRVKPVQINLSNFDKPGITVIDQTTLLSRLSRSVSDETDVISFSPSSFTVSIEPLTTKKVPVRPIVEATFSGSWFLSESPYSSPDSVFVTGPESILDSMQFITTELAVFKELEEDGSREVDLRLNAGLEVSQNEVIVHVDVDQWIEKEFRVPISIPSVKGNLEMKTFPPTATVTCQVGMKNFDQFSNDMFAVTVSTSDPAKLRDEFKVPLEITRSPSGVRNTQVSPESVEFVLVEN